MSNIVELENLFVNYNLLLVIAEKVLAVSSQLMMAMSQCQRVNPGQSLQSQKHSNQCSHNSPAVFSFASLVQLFKS